MSDRPAGPSRCWVGRWSRRATAGRNGLRAFLPSDDVPKGIFWGTAVTQQDAIIFKYRRRENTRFEPLSKNLAGRAKSIVPEVRKAANSTRIKYRGSTARTTIGPNTITHIPVLKLKCEHLTENLRASPTISFPCSEHHRDVVDA